MDFTEQQVERYSRHILLPQVGPEGQAKLLESSVLIVGAGGLGAPASLYLAAAGVGRIGLVDFDVVDLSNLQRQIVHGNKDVGRPKAISAKESLEAINTDVKIEVHEKRFDATNAAELIKNYDFILDGTDNFPTKFLINDACVMGDKPYSHGGILRFEGQTTTVKPGESACYRCVFREPPPPGQVPTCAEAGVFGAIAGMLGTIQAAEAIKYLLGIGEPLHNKLLIFDALKMNFRNVKVKKNPKCPVCGDAEFRSITELVEAEQAVCAI